MKERNLPPPPGEADANRESSRERARERERERERGKKREGLHTVDGDSDALRQNVAVSTLESGDLSERVYLEVFGTDALGGLLVDELDVETVGFRDHQEGGSAGVVLAKEMSVFFSLSLSLSLFFSATRWGKPSMPQKNQQVHTATEDWFDAQEASRSFRTTSLKFGRERERWGGKLRRGV